MLLADSLLKSGEGGCPPAFIIDCLLQSHLEIFDRPRESDTKRVGFFRNELDLLSQEAEGFICHVGAGEIHFPLIPSPPNSIWP